MSLCKEKIKRCAIFYFSGTGNTKKVVDEYVKHFKIFECTASFFCLPLKEEITSLEEWDFIGFAYPVHAFNAPSVMLGFLKNLPTLKVPKNVFVLSTSGEPVKMNHCGTLKVRAILKKRNYILTNEYNYVMPYNMVFRHTEQMAYKMWETAKKLIALDVKQILNKENAVLPKVFAGKIVSFVLRIEQPAMRLNGKLFRCDDSCNKCGRCIRECPFNNIFTDKEGTIRFSNRCMMCARCAFFCDKNAIKIGLLNGLKVNGAYSFTMPEQEEKDAHKDYCAKAYARYFSEAEKRIAQQYKE